MSSKILGNVWDACAAHGIKGAKLMIMARLADYSNDDGGSYPSVETICRQLGLGESTVRTAITELESAGWLRRESRRKGNRNSSNMYHLNADRLEYLARIERDKVQAEKERRRAALFAHPSESDGSEFEGSESGGSNGFHPSDSGKNGVLTLQNLTPDPQGLKPDPQVTSKHEPQPVGASADAAPPTGTSGSDKSPGKTTSKQPAARQEYSPDFEQAWQAYPRRAGGNPKATAYKHWKARIANGTTAAELLAGVQRYAAYIRATGKLGTEYVKQAATFFGPDRHFEESWTPPAAPNAPGGARGAMPSCGFRDQDYGSTNKNFLLRGNKP